MELADVITGVRLHGPCTRAALVGATGLSRTVVTQRVAALLDRGLIAEAGRGPSTGGRAPQTLRLATDSGHLLVADLGATSIDVAVADLSGQILAHIAEPADISTGPQAVLSRVEALFGRCSARVKDLRGELWGIGVGVPGPVEFESGRPVAPPIMPGWDGYDIRERLAKYRVPVWVDNDVSVMAIGEVTAGSGRGHEDMLFIKIGTGIGAGIIVGGKLHRGSQGCAGDIGHIQVPHNEREVICRCGNVGCLEALAGGAALGRDAELAAREGRSEFLERLLDERGSLTAADVTLAASHGDTASIELITSAGREIGLAVATMVNLLNPSLIVLGGGVADAGDLLLATIRQAVYRRSLPLATRHLVIRQSSLGGRAGVIGAAAMVANELFAAPFLTRWLLAGNPVGQAQPVVAA
jgi:glucokinase-like ROK family protein